MGVGGRRGWWAALRRWNELGPEGAMWLSRPLSKLHCLEYLSLWCGRAAREESGGKAGGGFEQAGVCHRAPCGAAHSIRGPRVAPLVTTRARQGSSWGPARSHSRVGNSAYPCQQLRRRARGLDDVVRPGPL